MAQLPQFQGYDDEAVQLLQNKWAAILNPIISAPQNNSLILKNVQLSVGDNSIDHRLGRTLQGWKIVRQRAAASIYDKQDTNQTPQLTLKLNSSAAVSVDLEVF